MKQNKNKLKLIAMDYPYTSFMKDVSENIKLIDTFEMVTKAVRDSYGPVNINFYARKNIFKSENEPYMLCQKRIRSPKRMRKLDRLTGNLSYEILKVQVKSLKSLTH